MESDIEFLFNTISDYYDLYKIFDRDIALNNEYEIIDKITPNIELFRQFISHYNYGYTDRYKIEKDKAHYILLEHLCRKYRILLKYENTNIITKYSKFVLDEMELNNKHLYNLISCSQDIILYEFLEKQHSKNDFRVNLFNKMFDRCGIHRIHIISLLFYAIYICKTKYTNKRLNNYLVYLAYDINERDLIGLLYKMPIINLSKSLLFIKISRLIIKFLLTIMISIILTYSFTCSFNNYYSALIYFTILGLCEIYNYLRRRSYKFIFCIMCFIVILLLTRKCHDYKYLHPYKVRYDLYM